MFYPVKITHDLDIFIAAPYDPWIPVKLESWMCIVLYRLKTEPQPIFSSFPWTELSDKCMRCEYSNMMLKVKFSGILKEIEDNLIFEQSSHVISTNRPSKISLNLPSKV